jgi:UDP-GlcNAc:undecaprenyl-phosphate GlcNAc-1-phosphate transferase
MTGLSLFLVFGTALTLTFSIIPFVLRFAHARGLYDQPDFVVGADQSLFSRRVHTQPMPRLGGIGMVIGFFASVLIWAAPSPLLPFYFASFVTFLIGIWDDVKPLPAALRLFLQIIISTFVVLYLNVPIRQLHLSSEVFLNINPTIGAIFSIFIMVGAINAVNLTDGLDGLAGGVVMIGIVLLSTLYFLTTKDLNLIFCLSLPLLGALLGFLKYNTHPASIFMGDGGSNWLGLMVGVLLVIILSGSSIVSTDSGMKLMNTNNSVPLFSAILCIALPVLDTAFVMIRRVAAGKNPMSADKTHFHHTLLHIGFTHSQSVTAIYFLSFTAGILGLMPVAYPNYNLNWTWFFAIGLWVSILGLSLQIDENAVEKILKFRSRIFSAWGIGPIYKKIVIWLEILNRYLIYGILSVVPLLAGIPHTALGYVSIIGLVMMLIATFGSDRSGFFQSFVISVSSAILLTAINFNSLHVSFLGTIYNIQYVYNAIFIVLLVSTLLYILLTLRRRYFLVTPTDFLMIALPFSLLIVPEPYQTEFKLNIISLRSLILFLSIRVLTRRYQGAVRRIMFMCALGLIYVFLVAVCELRITY